MNLLSLSIFNHAKDSTATDTGVALKRIAWAIATIISARDNPDSGEGRALRKFGFLACIFKAPLGVVHVEKFDRGHVAHVSDDGRLVIKAEGQGPANVEDALAWLTMIQNYVTWVVRVEEAANTGSRPPVFDNIRLMAVPTEIRHWIGLKADQYFKTWHARSRSAHAATATLVAAG